MTVRGHKIVEVLDSSLILRHLILSGRHVMPEGKQLEIGMRLTVVKCQPSPWFSSILLIIVLGGCTMTPVELRARTPSATYTTSKPPKAVADCLQNRLGPLALVRRGNRASISSRDMDTGVAIDIVDGGSVQVWRFLPFEGETRRHVEACL